MSELSLVELTFLNQYLGYMDLNHNWRYYWDQDILQQVDIDQEFITTWTTIEKSDIKFLVPNIESAIYVEGLLYTAGLQVERDTRVWPLHINE